eukprot:2235523-Alexandrium_andersonii.AAC.1
MDRWPGSVPNRQNECKGLQGFEKVCKGSQGLAMVCAGLLGPFRARKDVRRGGKDKRGLAR